MERLLQACRVRSSEGVSTAMTIRIYVGNLPYTFRDEQVTQLFAPYGEVGEVHVIMDRTTGQSKGFAFVDMASDQAARKAIAELNGAQVGERTLNVSEARPREERPNRRDYR
jgi:cold-inducible RNA-binding protein